MIHPRGVTPRTHVTPRHNAERRGMPQPRSESDAHRGIVIVWRVIPRRSASVAAYGACPPPDSAARRRTSSSLGTVSLNRGVVVSARLNLIWAAIADTSG